MKQNVSIYIERDLEQKVRRLASLEDKTFSVFVCELLQAALAFERERVVLDHLVPELVQSLGEMLKSRENRWANLLARVAIDTNTNRRFVLNALSEASLGPQRASAINEDAYKAAIVDLKTRNEDIREIIEAVSGLDDAREVRRIIREMRDGRQV